MMASAPTDLSIRQSGDVTVVEFLDRRLVDAQHIEAIGQQLLNLVKSAGLPKLVLNFEKVEYLSSSALNILIALDNAIKQKRGALCLANLHADLMKVFTLMKLHKVMKICKSTDDALKALA